MSKIIMYRTVSGFTPADQGQWEELTADRIKIGDLVQVDVKKPRNLQFHKKYWALINQTFDMQDQFSTINQWRLVCQAGAGYCEFVTGKDGQMVAIPKSIAFHKMDETEFARLFDDVIKFMCDRYLDRESVAKVAEYL